VEELGSQRVMAYIKKILGACELPLPGWKKTAVVAVAGSCYRPVSQCPKTRYYHRSALKSFRLSLLSRRP
jgi:hypothetical protein